MGHKPLFRRILEQMSTDQLDEFLHSELEETCPDDDSIRLILTVLREREKDSPLEINSEILKTWEQYKNNSDIHKRQLKILSALNIASVLVIICVIFLSIPSTAKATVAEFFTRCTDSVYALIDPNGIHNNNEYVFETDHSGLQKIYDSAISIGIIEPVVPMWLPGNTTLTQCETVLYKDHKKLISRLEDDVYNIVFTIDIFDSIVPHEYQKDTTDVKFREINGVVHTIIKNYDMWSVFWVNGNTECLLTINCNEDDLFNILNSIYYMEG